VAKANESFSISFIARKKRVWLNENTYQRI
jgi:hypothetical protein